MAIRKPTPLLTSKDLNVRPPPSVNIHTTGIVERPPLPLTLPTLHWQEVCHDYYGGYCRRGADCSWSHAICHVQGMATPTERAPHRSSKPNRLTLEPRSAHEGGPFDDDDGPASLFWLAPKHNNDHSEIGHIRILPTTDEILCQKRPFMPRKDAQNGTNERRGIARMLDVQFRHLRYDTLEPVVDACYHASQFLATTFQDPPSLDYEARQNTVRGTQYSLFRDVRLEDSRFETGGMHLRLSFACPAHLRQSRMLSSGHFESGMLMALVGLDSENTLSTAFLIVEMCQSTLSMKPITGNHLRASVVASFVEPSDTDTMRQTLYGLKGLLNKEKFVIVEFSKILVAGFYWILKHLQFLSSSNAEIAFANLIAPSDPTRSEIIAAPAYSSCGSSPFDLSVLQRADTLDGPSSLLIDPDYMALGPARQQDITGNVCSTTTLDSGQATALCENLSRGLAFTQGPPGTGKTFLGVSLAKVILKHTPQKPILVACMTNHALDNFLGDLVKQGITKIARIGSGSKEEWMDKYTLPSIRKTFERSERSLAQKTKADRAFNAVQALWYQGTTWCDSLNTHNLTWAAVADHLKFKYPYAYSDFSRYEAPSEQKVSDIRRGRSEAGGYAFEHWSTGRDLTVTEAFSRDAGSFFNKSTPGTLSVDGSSDSESSSVDIAQNPPHIPVAYPYDDLGQDVWSMPMDIRAAWITRWKSELGSSSPVDKLVEIQRRYLEAKRIKKDLLDESDVKGLASQEVIGLTTTACAKYWSMLKSLDLETLICEEAGEVSEAQTITALLPSIKHAIFIGDPLQLRPQVNQSSLSLETPYGTKYRLDESLFERMVMPSDPSKQPLPVSRLDLQRRMHPEVAQLMRSTLYPYLKDHPSTSHLPVAGMAHRTFWLDHQEPEDAPNSLVTSGKSYSNAFECAMICELVRYLLNTNDFGSGEIAIIVPYSQQLARLREKLTGTRSCSIALSEKDKEDLMDMGLLDESEQSQFRTDVEVSPMVRLATIDGFQGEEAKVIILSTVRSNLQDRVGFLQTTNRINVACSRARNGFYIVGNSTLLRTVDMWATIVADFEARGRLGTSFTTHCSRHPQQTQAVSQPHQFQEVLACNEPCNHVFSCGHGCPEACHEPVLHDRMICQESCSKQHDTCGHQCNKACGEPCGDCSETVLNESLPCGHTHSVKCTDLQEGKQTTCSAPLEPIILPCGHSMQRTCASKDQPLICDSQCDFVHECGHPCGRKCSECSENGSHGRCEGLCLKQHPCGHHCPAKCHSGSACPPCNLPCLRSCEHGRVCRRPCRIACDPCVQSCQKSSCPHQVCTAICSLPCNRLPCGLPCTNVLSCSHICPGLCGERCADVCLQCETGKLPSETKIFLPCGHDFNVADLDRQLGLGNLFDISTFGEVLAMKSTMAVACKTPQCPQCHAPCGSVARYRNLGQMQLAPDALERLYRKFGRKMHMFAKNVQAYRKNLQNGIEWFCDNFQPGPLTGQANAAMIKTRMLYIVPMEAAITRFRDEVVVRVEKDIVSTTLLLGRSYTPVPVKLSFKVRLDLLHLHCRLTVVQEAARIVHFLRDFDNPKHAEHMVRILKMHTIQAIDQYMAAAEELVDYCRSNSLVLLEAETLLVQLSFDAVGERLGCVADNGERHGRMEQLIRENPDTAGTLRPCYQCLDPYTKGKNSTAELWTSKTREIWEKWGDHEMGSLGYCKNGHPYSRKAFPGCPECGGRKVRGEQIENGEEFVKHLDREMFLKAMATLA